MDQNIVDVDSVQHVDLFTVVITHHDSDHDERYDIHGVLDTGEKVTLVGAAREPSVPYDDQSFSTLTLMRGGHVEGSDVGVSQVVITYPNEVESWLAQSGEITYDIPLRDAPPAQARLAEGRLEVNLSDAQASLRDLQGRVLGPTGALFSILLRREVPALTTTVILASTSEQISIQRRASEAPAVQAKPVHEAVLPAHELSSKGLTGWYALALKIHPVHMITAKALTRPNDIEARILFLAASLESVHSTCCDSEEPWTKGQRRKVREEALANIPDWARIRVGEALSGSLQSTSFSERLFSLLNMVGEDFARELAGPMLEDPNLGRSLWVRLVKDARNGSAHAAARYPDDVDEYTNRMFCLFETLGWLITAVMLMSSGVSREQAANGVRRMSGYRYTRERCAGRLSDIYAP